MRFPGGSGAELSARIDAPADETPHGAFLLLHAFGSSKDLKSTSRIAEILAAAGFFVLRFDFTGVGQSGGDFARATFSTHVADAMAAATWLRGNARAANGGARDLEPLPLFLFGHSFGGIVGLRLAHMLPECRGAALLGTPSTTYQLAEILMRRAPEVMTAGEAEVETIGKKVRIGRAMIDELLAHDVLADVRDLGRDIFVMHSRADEISAPEYAEELFAAAKPLKSLMQFYGADHLLLKREGDARLVGKALAAWAQPR